MSVTSTLDRIKDTTIMRMIRKMAGVIDEQTASVKAVNDKLDNFNLDGVETQLAKNTSDIGQLKISDNEHTTQITTLDSNVDNHARAITNLKASDAKQNSDIEGLNTLTDALTKELPTEITLYRDGTGKIRAQVTKEDNTVFDSNTLDMIIPYQYSIISGTSARSFKLDITTSDGNHIITNDFLIPEGGGTDITVTSVTLIKDPVNSNKVKVSIGLSDGTPLESGYVEMVNAVSGTFANNKLTITVNGVSSVPITIDTTGTVYSPGTGIKIASGTISIDDTVVALKSDISDMETKTNANATFETKVNANATYATKIALNNLQNQVGDAFTEVAIGADGKSLDFTTLNGQVNNIEIPSSDNWILWTGTNGDDLMDLTTGKWKNLKIEASYFSAYDSDAHSYQGDMIFTYIASSYVGLLTTTQNKISIGSNFKLDMSLCNRGKVYYNTTAGTLVTNDNESIDNSATKKGDCVYRIHYKN